VNAAGVGASGAIFALMGAYVVLALIRHKPMGPVVALIVINLVIGFTGNIEWQAHVGGSSCHHGRPRSTFVAA